MKTYIELEAAKEAAHRAEIDANWDGRKFTAECVEDALDFTPTVEDVIPWMWLETFAKTKTFKDIETFLREAKEMCVKMQNCCCF